MAGNAGVLKVIQRNEDLDQAASSRQDARSAVASSRQMGMGAEGPGGVDSGPAASGCESSRADIPVGVGIVVTYPKREVYRQPRTGMPAACYFDPGDGTEQR